MELWPFNCFLCVCACVASDRLWCVCLEHVRFLSSEVLLSEVQCAYGKHIWSNWFPDNLPDISVANQVHEPAGHSVWSELGCKKIQVMAVGAFHSLLWSGMRWNCQGPRKSKLERLQNMLASCLNIGLPYILVSTCHILQWLVRVVWNLQSCENSFQSGWYLLEFCQSFYISDPCTWLCKDRPDAHIHTTFSSHMQFT